MKKLSQADFDQMDCRELRRWVEANCVAKPAGRPRGTSPDAVSDAERARRYRERKKLLRV